MLFAFGVLHGFVTIPSQRTGCQQEQSLGDLYLIAQTPREGPEPLPCYERLNYILSLASYTVGVNTFFNWSFLISFWNGLGRGLVCVCLGPWSAAGTSQREQKPTQRPDLSLHSAHQEKTGPFVLCGICKVSSSCGSTLQSWRLGTPPNLMLFQSPTRELICRKCWVLWAEGACSRWEMRRDAPSSGLCLWCTLCLTTAALFSRPLLQV